MSASKFINRLNRNVLMDSESGYAHRLYLDVIAEEMEQKKQRCYRTTHVVIVWLGAITICTLLVLKYIQFI